MATLWPQSPLDGNPGRRSRWAWGSGGVAAMAAYCLLHEMLAPEPHLSVLPLLWALFSLLPWMIAFEAIQRLAPARRETGLIMAVAFAAAPWS